MRFTRYELVQKIAVGGMAEVWAARAFGADGAAIDVVVKRILPQFADDATFQHMLLEEAEVTARLRHPNIVRVLDWGHLDETCFLAMEHVHGLDGRQLLAACAMRKVHVPPAVALHAVAEILAGLDYAHARDDDRGSPLGIVHRDISPANVLLSVDGSVKLSDFGIAKAKTRASHTRVGRVRGKPRYMSPEQARGETLDGRSDLFSAGLVLHELLTGSPVFPQSEYLAQVVAIIERGIPAPSQVNPSLPPDLDALVLSLCERDLARRYPTCGAARDAILSWAAKRGLRLAAVPVAELVRSIVRPTQTVKPTHADGVTRIARLEDVGGVPRFASVTDGGASEVEAIPTRISALPPAEVGALPAAEPSASTVTRRGPVPEGTAAGAEPSVPTAVRRGPVPENVDVEAEPSVPTAVRRGPVPADVVPEATERRESRAPPAAARRPWMAVGAVAAVVVALAGVWRVVLAPAPVVVTGAGTAATPETRPDPSTALAIARSVEDFVVAAPDPAAIKDAPESDPERADAANGRDTEMADEIPADALIGDDEEHRPAPERLARPRGGKAPRGRATARDAASGSDRADDAVTTAREVLDGVAAVSGDAAAGPGGATAAGPAAAVAQASAQPSPTPAGKGWLSLRARPNGEVTIDGQWAGRTPISRQELPAGEHTVVVHADDGRKATAIIVIEADLVTSQTLDLK